VKRREEVSIPRITIEADSQRDALALASAISWLLTCNGIKAGVEAAAVAPTAVKLTEEFSAREAVVTAWWPVLPKKRKP
jgi:hypothetical protein